MSERILAAQVALVCVARRIRNSELGQGSAEYAGVIVVAAALVLALIGGATEWSEQLKNTVGDLIKQIKPGG